MEKAYSHIALLQKYEKASSTYEVIHQDKEDLLFWNLWGLSSPPETKYKVNPEWDDWFEDVKKAEARPKEHPAVYTLGRCQATIDEEEEELKRQREMKPRLYTYPDAEEFATVFEYDDLQGDSLICLCIKPVNKQYIWSGIDFEGGEEEVKKYAEEVKRHCWKDNSSGVVQNFQTQEGPSSSFLEYFD